jgi:prepilin-type N-terminal cleavage/methylation domain-containing protein
MQCTARRRASGFTLVELMIIVVILGVLATVAIPQYQGYVYRSKTTEAVGFLAEIKMRQESYRADFGQYCKVSADAEDFYPSTKPTPKHQAWGSSALWTQLGAVPPGGQVLFSYATVAGTPGDVSADATARGFTGSDFWFFSRAKGDLDGDEIYMYLENYSAGAGLHIEPEQGWE